MTFARAVKNLFAIPADRPQLMVAQARAYSAQVPLMYAIVLINAVALAATHYHVAPRWLTAGVIALLGVVCAWRMLSWRRQAREALDAATAHKRLKATMRTAILLGVAFSAWSLSLYQYGDAYTRGHIAFYMGITSVICIVCLMHMRSAALLVTICVMGPMVAFFGATGVPVFQAIAANMAIVTVGLIAIMLKHSADFAALVASRAENDRLANLDALTQIPNRRRFFIELEQRIALARASGGSRGIAVGVIDLDGFKPVNDAFGHSTGDRLLIVVASRLANLPFPGLLVSRLGGDEFGLILEGDVSDTPLQEVGAALCASLARPFELPGVVAQITASVGFCPLSHGKDEAIDLFERADYALYHAKQHQKGRPVIFSARHEAEIRRLSLIEQALRHADLESEMRIEFQPIVDLNARRTVGFEALARWRHPELGDVAPVDFIRAAERSGYITELTKSLLRKALRAALAWPRDTYVSVNLSARDISAMDAVDELIAIVRRSPIDPRRIVFEITETAIVCDYDQARNALLALRELGVKVSLDDFGTGHSSLTHVRTLPIDSLKLDGSFMQGIEGSQQSQDIVRTVLELCRNLRLGCIIEGVEASAQVDLLQCLGARLAQGYHFGRPMPEAEASEHLMQEMRRRALKTLPADRPAADRPAAANPDGARANLA